jgi:predicted dehydrogenase
MKDTPTPPRHSNRRQFLKTSGAVTLGAVASGPFLSFPQPTFAQNSDTLRVGLIGCGGRGTGAANQALHADPNVVLTAMADAFEEQLHHSLASLQKDPEIAARVKVTPETSFVGLDAYQKLIHSGVDVVLLATPPGFRPQHLRAAIAAGKHVFCEKPMATDAPGVRSVLESAALAKQKKLSLVSGFCWRYDFARREFYQRVHDGALGELRAIYATYYTSPVKPMPPASQRRPGMTDLEWQLRNWYNFVWLSGDGLVEQCVHSIDKMAWAKRDVPPIKCVATGGRQIPNNEGNIYDHINAVYEYEDGTMGFVGQRQISGCYNQNADYLMGTRGNGFIGTRYPQPTLTGENPWRYRGPGNNMYQTEHDELFASIRAGRPLNDGVWMAHSTLTAIMGRMAAYTGREITWQEALESQEQLVPTELDWNMKLPIAPMAMPGRTKLV